MVETPRVSEQGAKIFTFWLVAGLVALIDQATKVAVRVAAPEVGRMGTLVPGLLDLYHVENSGAAFSIGEGAGIFFVVVAVVVIGCTYAFVCVENPPISLTVSLAAVAGGGAGNMISRLLHGTVTDFIATTFMDFPVFNVADIFVTCGVVVSLVLFLRLEHAENAAEASRA